jgi:hypothetical protein
VRYGDIASRGGKDADHVDFVRHSAVRVFRMSIIIEATASRIRPTLRSASALSLLR